MWKFSHQCFSLTSSSLFQDLYSPMRTAATAHQRMWPSCWGRTTQPSLSLGLNTARLTSWSTFRTTGTPITQQAQTGCFYAGSTHPRGRRHGSVSTIGHSQPQLPYPPLSYRTVRTSPDSAQHHPDRTGLGTGQSAPTDSTIMYRPVYMWSSHINYVVTTDIELGECATVHMRIYAWKFWNRQHCSSAVKTLSWPELGSWNCKFIYFTHTKSGL